MDEIWLEQFYGSISTYLHHFSSILDVFGLILMGKPVLVTGMGFWGTGTGWGWVTHGLPVTIPMHHPQHPQMKPWLRVDCWLHPGYLHHKPHANDPPQPHLMQNTCPCPQQADQELEGKTKEKNFHEKRGQQMCNAMKPAKKELFEWLNAQWLGLWLSGYAGEEAQGKPE